MADMNKWIEKFARNVQYKSFCHTRWTERRTNTTHYINPCDTHMDQKFGVVMILLLLLFVLVKMSLKTAGPLHSKTLAALLSQHVT